MRSHALVEATLPRVRRALLFGSGERYTVAAVHFVMVAVVSRLLTPEEIGISVAGTATIAIAEALRDCPTGYFIQQKEITRAEARTAFTVMCLLSVVLVGALLGLAGPIARFFRDDRLVPFLGVIALALLPGPFERPIMALFRREMDFRTLAIINVLVWLVYAIATITLAWSGFGYMSFAWGVLAGNFTAALLTICLRPDLWMFRPHLGEWRSTLSFGGYNGATALLARAYELLPSIVLGRAFPLHAVGLYSRAVMVCQLPDKTILSAVAPVAMSAFAAEAHRGRNLKQLYLRAVEHLTVVQWPMLIVLACLAHPVVAILLGGQWLSVVPLVQIMALAGLLSFPMVLAYPVLLSTGGIREIFASYIIALPVCALVVALAASLGLQALALSLFLTLPFQAFVTTCFVRRHVPFDWRELRSAVSRSALVALCSAAGPGTAIVLAGFRFDLSIAAGFLAGMMAVAGWAIGLWLTRHPLLFEIRHAAGIISKRASRPTSVSAAT